MALHFRTKSRSTSILANGSPSNNQSEILIVTLHGIFDSFDRIDPVVDLARSTFDLAETWTPILPYRGWSGLLEFSGTSQIVDWLLEDLNKIWRTSNYRSIKIVGHSMGGILARRLLLKGIQHLRNYDRDGSNIAIENQPRRRYWADASNNSEDRLVLLAAANRGAGPTRHMSLSFFLASTLAIWLANLLASMGKPPTLLAAARGSKYLTDLRLDWLAEDSQKQLPVTVQLLGSTDDVVGPEDSLDLITGENFRYIDVENTGHLSILDVAEDATASVRPFWQKPNPEQSEKIKAQRCRRRDIIRAALVLNPDCSEFSDLEVRPWDLSEVSNEEKDRRQKIEDVIFVVHGIRDQGHWTDKVARRIWSNADESHQNKIEKVVDSYGYFGMGPFLFYGVRSKKVAWFMEKYIEARSMYPQARFHFVGHSHGTYLLAKSIEEHPECRFDNVVFAGSIVRTAFDWNFRIRETKQIKKLLNIVATHDWVVAWFPRFFDFYNLQDIGGAGHVGFRQSSEDGPVYTLRYAKGAHSAATKEHWWDTIANFVLTGKFDSTPPEKGNYLSNRLYSMSGVFVSTISYINFIVWFLAAAFVILVVPLGIIKSISWIWPAASDFWSTVFLSGNWKFLLLGLLAVGYAFLIGKQAKYRRPLGWLRSIAILPIIGAIIWLAKEFFGSWYLGLLPSANELSAHQLIVTTSAVFAWFVALMWLLRKA